MIVDGICRAIKRMSRAMGKPHTLNMKRYTEYARKLQEFLYAQESFVENVTLQLLDLTAGHSGVEHEDTSNDIRASYDSTAAKVFNLIDSRGSLKIVCSFRKKLGDFYSVKMSIINSLLVNIRTMLAGVNSSYYRLVSHHKGSHSPIRIPTWDDTEGLFLDHDSPWECRVIAGNIVQERLSVLTGIARGLWLSLALSAIDNIAEHYDERGMVQLLIIMSWQNSFSHFWEVCRRMGTAEAQYPIFEYQKTAYGLFHVEGKDKGQEMIGGDNPRFGPIGFDFNEIFGTKDKSPEYELVDKVVDIVLELLDSVNREFSPEDAVVTRETVMELVEDASRRINSVAKCELGPFRLMILLQGCAHLGVRLQIGKHLREMHYKMKSVTWVPILPKSGNPMSPCPILMSPKYSALGQPIFISYTATYTNISMERHTCPSTV
jgi:hypothetical protein